MMFNPINRRQRETKVKIHVLSAVHEISNVKIKIHVTVAIYSVPFVAVTRHKIHICLHVYFSRIFGKTGTLNPEKVVLIIRASENENNKRCNKKSNLSGS